MALACVLSGVASRRTQWKRILFAVTILLTLLASAVGLENYIARKNELLPILYVHAILPILLGLFVLIKPYKRRFSNGAPDDLSVTRGA